MPSRIRARLSDYGRRHGVLLAIVVGTLCSAAGRFALPAVLPTIRSLFELSSTETGYVLTALVIGFGLSQFPGGRIADQRAPKPILIAGVALFVLGFAVLVGSVGYGVILLGALLIGVGNGLYVPASLSELQRTFPDRVGRAYGINGGAVQLGSAIGPVLAAGAIFIGFWQAAFIPLIAGLGLTFVLLLRWVPSRTKDVGPVSFEARSAIRRVLTLPAARGTLLAFMGIGFCYQGAVNFLPLYMEDARGFSPTLASLVFGGVFVVATVVNPVAGALGDRVGLVRMAAGTVALSLPGVLLLLLADTRLFVIMGIVMFGVGLASFWPLMDAFVMGALPDHSQAGDFGALNTISLLGGSVGPIYMGAVADARSLAAAYAGVVLVLLAVLILLVLLRRHDRKPHE